jgi:hypothetical protein
MIFRAWAKLVVVTKPWSKASISTFWICVLAVCLGDAHWHGELQHAIRTDSRVDDNPVHWSFLPI